MLAGQVEHRLAELGVAAELAASSVEQHVRVQVRGAGAARAPGEEAIDVRIGLEALGELLRHQVEAAGPQLRVVHRREGVEDRPVEGPAQLDGDVGGGLLGNLPDDDLVLLLQGGHRPVLQVKDQSGRTEGGGDGQDEGRRTPAPPGLRHRVNVTRLRSCARNRLVRHVTPAPGVCQGAPVSGSRPRRPPGDAGCRRPRWRRSPCRRPASTAARRARCWCRPGCRRR